MRGNGESYRGSSVYRGNGHGDVGSYADDNLDDMSTNEVVKELVRHTRELIKDEVRLIRLELEEDRRRLGDVGIEGRSYIDEARSRAQHDLHLAGADLRVAGRRTKKAAVSLGSGGVLLHAGIYLALFALVFVFATFLPLWAAATIVAVLTLCVGAGLLAKGKHELDEVENPFTRISHQIKEDGRWIGRTLAGLKARTAETLRDAKSTLKESVSRRSHMSSDGERRDVT
jgi:hypothetical protein